MKSRRRTPGKYVHKSPPDLYLKLKGMEPPRILKAVGVEEELLPLGDKTVLVVHHDPLTIEKKGSGGSPATEKTVSPYTRVVGHVTEDSLRQEVGSRVISRYTPLSNKEKKAVERILKKERNIKHEIRFSKGGRVR